MEQTYFHVLCFSYDLYLTVKIECSVRLPNGTDLSGALC